MLPDSFLRLRYVRMFISKSYSKNYVDIRTMEQTFIYPLPVIVKVLVTGVVMSEVLLVL